MSDEPIQLPAPGSDAAIDAGCTCPIYDNRHGVGLYQGPDGPLFVMDSECPLHGGGMLVLPQDEPVIHLPRDFSITINAPAGGGGRETPIGFGLTPLPEATGDA